MTEKELNNLLYEAIGSLCKCISYISKSTFYGIKRLNKVKNVVFLIVSFIVTLVGYMLKDKILNYGDVPIYIRFFLYYMLLFSPVEYLIFLGNYTNRNIEKYKKIFQEIDFKGRNGKFPIFVAREMQGKKVIYIFKSNIPLQEWKNAKERLEQALNCNILRFMVGKKDKKIIKLITVPSECVIPEKLDWDKKYLDEKESILTIGVGAVDVIKIDLDKTPHVLVAGETGSGKSVILKNMAGQMVEKGSRIYMMDFKGGVEFGKKYDRLGEVVTDRNRAVKILDELLQENEYRLSVFRDLEVNNITEYNEKTGQNLCRIGIFADEVAEMLDKKGVPKAEREVYEQITARLSSLARRSRASGINLILGIQRPDANVLVGQIKNNIPVRICGRFADKPASEIVLGNSMAVDLPDIKGRFLFRLGNETIEFQAFYYNVKMMGDVSIESGEMLTKASKYKNLEETKVRLQEPVQEPEKTEIKYSLGDNYEDGFITWSVDDKEKKERIALNFDFEESE